MVPSLLTTVVPLAGSVLTVMVTRFGSIGAPLSVSLAITLVVTGVFCAVVPVPPAGSSVAVIAGADTVMVTVAVSQLAGFSTSHSW